MPTLLAGVDAAAAALDRRRRRRRGRGDPHHRHRRQAAPSRTGDGWTVGGMAKGAGMLAPGLATMLCVLTTDAVVDAAALDAALRGRDRARPSTGSTPTAACRPTTPCCCWPAARPGVTPDPGELRRRRARGLRRPRRAAARRRRGRDQGGRASRSSAPPPRTTPSRSAARSPATTCSSARCSATTRTGAGCSPRSAPPSAAFEPGRARRRDQRRPGLPRRRGGRRRATASTSPAGDVHILVDLHAGDAHGDDLDQRPVARLRRRELGVLVMSRRLATGPARWPRPRRSSTRCPGCERFHGKIVVVKYGGNAMTDARAAARPSPRTSCSCATPGSSRSSCTAAARRSPSTSTGSASRREFRGGLRVTTPEAMAVVRMVLVGQVNGEVVNLHQRPRPVRGRAVRRGRRPAHRRAARHAIVDGERGRPRPGRRRRRGRPVGRCTRCSTPAGSR